MIKDVLIAIADPDKKSNGTSNLKAIFRKNDPILSAMFRATVSLLLHLVAGRRLIHNDLDPKSDSAINYPHYEIE